MQLKRSLAGDFDPLEGLGVAVGRRGHRRPTAQVPAAGHLLRRLAGYAGGGLSGSAQRHELIRLGYLHVAAREPRHRVLPGRAAGAAAHEQDRRLGIEAGALFADPVEGLDQRGHGALVGGEQDLLAGGGVAQAGHHAGGARQVGGALAVEVGEHYHAGALGGGVAVEAEPFRHPVDRQRGVERGRQGQEAAAGVRETGDRAAGIGGPLVHRRVGGAGGAQADHRLAGTESQTERRAHVVARAGADHRALGEPQLAGGRPGQLAGRLARPEHVGKQLGIEVDQVQHVRGVALVLRGPPRGAGGVAPVGGAPAAEALGQEVVREPNRPGGRRRLGLMAAQPGPAGGGERGHGHQADPLRPGLRAAQRLGELSGLRRRAGVVPEDRGP